MDSVVRQLRHGIRSGRVKTVLAFLSGGKDSAAAAYIAYQFAKAMGLDFRLVFIDTTIALEETREYVRRYAEWLGAELVVLRPEKTFEEYARQYPYWPSLLHARWCFAKLKRKPLVQFLRQFPPMTVIQVLGIRRSESLFRESSPRSSRYTARRIGRASIRGSPCFTCLTTTWSVSLGATGFPGARCGTGWASRGSASAWRVCQSAHLTRL